MKKLYVLSALLFLVLFGFGQQAIYLTRGLLVNGVHSYGREALYSDTFAYRLYNHQLQKPFAGKTLATGANNEPIIWKEVEADSNHIFRTRGFGRGGYLYLTYVSLKEQNVLLNIQGNSAVFFNGVLHAGDPYSSGWFNIPVKLKKGLNELFVRTYYRTSVSLVFPARQVAIQTADSTLPYVVLQKQNGLLQGAVLVVNASDKPLRNYEMKASVGGREIITKLPVVPALSTRKVIFNFDAASVSAKGKEACMLSLLDATKVVDTKKLLLDVVDSTQQYSTTFISVLMAACNTMQLHHNLTEPTIVPLCFYRYMVRVLKQLARQGRTNLKTGEHW